MTREYCPPCHIDHCFPAPKLSLYTELKAAGCVLDNHYSDLYVLVEPKANEIIGAHLRNRLDRPYGSMISSFVSKVDGKLWWDIPFCFDPYWEARR